MKLRVFKAFTMTFTVLVRSGLDVLRIIWLSTALQIAAYFALMPGFLYAWTMIAADPPADTGAMLARMAPFILPALAFLLVLCATTIIIYSGLTRLIVRGEKPRLPFLLSWGADEWRLLAGWAIILAAFVALIVVFNIVSAIVAALGLLGRGPINFMLGLFGAFLVFLAGVWLGVRLSLFAPATIAERKVGVRSSWEKTEDDFWNLLGFWLLWVVLAIVVQLATFGLVTPPAYFEAMQGASFGSREAMLDTMRAANEALAQGFDISVVDNVLRMLGNYLIGAVGGVIGTVAGAVVWKLTTDPSYGEKHEPAPQPA
jgi:hypothetical protein